MAKNLAVLIIAVILVTINLSVYTISMVEQAVITQLGKPVRNVDEPGLHFKIPFIQKITKFPKQLLDYDSAPTEILTKDKKNLLIDNYAKWRILDSLKLLQTVRDTNGAQSRLDDIIYSELRVELGRHNLIDIVSTTRDEIMKLVTKRTNEKAKEYGISVLDVRIKRADMPQEIANSIYNRMRTERERIAKEYRAQGKEEAQKIRAKTDKEKIVLLAEAYKKEQGIRGEGDAESIKIYAKSLEKDPEFYSFIRSMEAYKVLFKEKSTIILPPDTEFFRFLKESK
ncbi:MAG: protease modulator HflC [Nitrospinota bacterium]|jgi:membrane protease subunit HflC|nr:protease modulator HflC [Nitrospinota bacterium]HJN02983.1 protease modulator HflC [Nitrospinota bacterium]